MTTFDSSNPTSDELNVGRVSYKPDASGAFVVPRHIADMVVAQPGGFYRGPDVAPAPAEKLAFNPVFNFNGGVTLANDVNGRLLALELAHFGRLNTFGDMPFVDSAGDAAVLTAAECRALSAEYRARLNASLA